MEELPGLHTPYHRTSLEPAGPTLILRPDKQVLVIGRCEEGLSKYLSSQLVVFHRKHEDLVSPAEVRELGDFSHIFLCESVPPLHTSIFSAIASKTGAQLRRENGSGILAMLDNIHARYGERANSKETATIPTYLPSDPEVLAPSAYQYDKERAMSYTPRSEQGNFSEFARRKLREGYTSREIVKAAQDAGFTCAKNSMDTTIWKERKKMERGNGNGHAAPTTAPPSIPELEAVLLTDTPTQQLTQPEPSAGEQLSSPDPAFSPALASAMPAEWETLLEAKIKGYDENISALLTAVEAMRDTRESCAQMLELARKMREQSEKSQVAERYASAITATIKQLQR
jgi:hypothetical protein